ncbi:MAG: bacillithiol biosynthesis cysteine-adding enzyme BshC [Aridibacter sp.]
MNSKPASFAEKEIYRQKLISFANIPNQTKLFVEYQNNSEDLENFYPTKNIKIREFAKEVLAEYKIDREAICRILKEENEAFGVGEKTLQNIEKLKQKDCVAVFTGQQAGLFSGPVYTIYKALSAIKLAEKLSNEGIKAVPIFWIASEDHDFDEISRTEILDAENKLKTIQNLPNTLPENSPVGFIKMDESITDSINKFIKNLQKTEFTENINELLVNSYKSGETFSRAFGKLLAKLFNKYGLILVSPMNEDLRKLSSPIFIEAIENAEIITKTLLEINKELEEKGYHAQVLVEKDFFPFFYIDDENKRNALRFDKEKSRIKSQNTKHEFTKEELIEIAKNNPQKLSPNALLRPVVQDFLFPTVCYFGGGAEIAYFGQNSIIYEILKRPVTPIKHRSSFTIIEGKHRRTLNKYNLNFADLFEGKEKILAEIVEKYLNTETAKIFAETEEIINTQLNRLDQHLHEDEPTLSDNLANRRRKILWHIGALRKKFHSAEIVKNEVINRRIGNLFTAILPDENLQERLLNVLHFLDLYGEHFIEWIYEAVNSEETEHQIIIF